MKTVAEIAHGPMFIGMVFNIFLFGMMVIQVYLYSVKYRRDHLWIKLFVLVVFTLDAINSVCDCVYLYDSLILHFADTSFLTTANWVFATEPAFTGVIAALVQVFFAWRVISLTKKRILGTILTLGAITGGALGIVTGCDVLKTPHFTDFQDFKIVVIFWLVIAASVDVIITATLVWYLVRVEFLAPHCLLSHRNEQRHQKTGFKQSDLMVDRIIRITMQTGFITSVFAVVDLIVYLADPTGTHLIFNFLLSKLYSNSLMSNLNSRRGWEGPTNFDPEQSGSGQEVASRYPSESRSRWKLTEINNEGEPRDLDNDAVNLRPLQTTAPGVFVHVESLEERDAAQREEGSFKSDDTTTVKLQSLAVVQKPAHVAFESDDYAKYQREDSLDKSMQI